VDDNIRALWVKGSHSQIMDRMSWVTWVNCSKGHMSYDIPYYDYCVLMGDKTV